MFVVLQTHLRATHILKKQTKKQWLTAKKCRLMHKHNTEKEKSLSCSVVAATVVYREKQRKLLDREKCILYWTK